MESAKGYRGGPPKEATAAIIKALEEQTADYGRPVGAEEAHLMIFDRRKGVSWDEKIYRREAQAEGGEAVTVWGCRAGAIRSLKKTKIALCFL